MSLLGWVLSGAVHGSEAVVAQPDGKRREALLNLLTHDCGACHGARMNGGLGPPLNASTLSTWSESALVATVLWGRPGTAMPGWQALLTEGEIRWLVRYLREGGDSP